MMAKAAYIYIRSALHPTPTVCGAQWFRGGLVFQAHRLLYHSSLGLRVIKKKKKVCGECNGLGLWRVRFRQPKHHASTEHLSVDAIEGSSTETPKAPQTSSATACGLKRLTLEGSVDETEFSKGLEVSVAAIAGSHLCGRG